MIFRIQTLVCGLLLVGLTVVYVHFGHKNITDVYSTPTVEPKGFEKGLGKAQNSGTANTVQSKRRVENVSSRQDHSINKQDKTISSLCESWVTQNMSKQNILEMYNSCVNHKTSNTAEVSPRMFDRLFTEDVFGGISCKDIERSFLSGEGRDRPLIALASFPGSGNTWVRILLEQMTGKLYLKNTLCLYCFIIYGINYKIIPVHTSRQGYLYVVFSFYLSVRCVYLWMVGWIDRWTDSTKNFCASS